MILIEDGSIACLCALREKNLCDITMLVTRGLISGIMRRQQEIYANQVVEVMQIG